VLTFVLSMFDYLVNGVFGNTHVLEVF
jgi:hypothetical protein